MQARERERRNEGTTPLLDKTLIVLIFSSSARPVGLSLFLFLSLSHPLLDFSSFFLLPCSLFSSLFHFNLFCLSHLSCVVKQRCPTSCIDVEGKCFCRQEFFFPFFRPQVRFSAFPKIYILRKLILSMLLRLIDSTTLLSVKWTV